MVIWRIIQDQIYGAFTRQNRLLHLQLLCNQDVCLWRIGEIYTVWSVLYWRQYSHRMPPGIHFQWTISHQVSALTHVLRDQSCWQALASWCISVPNAS